MIDALTSGNLIRDPSIKSGQSGKPFCNFLLSVPVGEEQPVIVSGIAFGETAEKIGRLRKGDALAVTGALKPSTWLDKATSETRHGLNVTVVACLSAYDARKRRGSTDTSAAGKPRPKEENAGFNDDLGF
ncbi:MAG: single-stranded DNA-binding protein [Methylococcaceae bacterium]|nr:single-stranded DNA-binding protein [Methylococcaceae bacterium]